MYRLGHLPAARHDLTEIVGRLREVAPQFEARFESVYKTAMHRILERPLMYAEDENGLRKVLLRPFSLQVGYVVDTDRVVILGVFHTSRHPSLWTTRTLPDDE